MFSAVPLDMQLLDPEWTHSSQQVLPDSACCTSKDNSRNKETVSMILENAQYYARKLCHYISGCVRCAFLFCKRQSRDFSINYLTSSTCSLFICLIWNGDCWRAIQHITECRKTFKYGLRTDWHRFKTISSPSFHLVAFVIFP
jgi:hypothetical protein